MEEKAMQLHLKRALRFGNEAEALEQRAADKRRQQLAYVQGICEELIGNLTGDDCELVIRTLADLFAVNLPSEGTCHGME